jgi:hypothetical protein
MKQVLELKNLNEIQDIYEKIEYFGFLHRILVCTAFIIGFRVVTTRNSDCTMHRTKSLFRESRRKRDEGLVSRAG